MHLVCHEDEFDDLLGDLALHRLDAVLADQPASQNPNLKVYTHSLGASSLAWYATASLYTTAKRDFPQSLSRTPVLLPTSHAAVRMQLDRWFERENIKPNVVGEFEDSALLATFGAAGMGAFPAPVLSHRDLMLQKRLRRLGPCTGVAEEFFLICTQRKVVHPLVQRLLSAHARARTREWRQNCSPLTLVAPLESETEAPSRERSRVTKTASARIPVLRETSGTRSDGSRRITLALSLRRGRRSHLPKLRQMPLLEGRRYRRPADGSERARGEECRENWHNCCARTNGARRGK